MKKITLAIIALLCILPARAQKRPELAPAPPMGWNSWNWYRKDLNEDIVKETIDIMKEKGLLELGYNYIVVDGGWRADTLSAKGELEAHPVKFPSGMKALADYAHAKGFKFGLHTVPGYYDCGCTPVGGWGNEAVQMQEFVDWGLDFIKLDRCKMTNGKDGRPNWTIEQEKEKYYLWSRLVHDCGRDITLSFSNYRYVEWDNILSNMSRTTQDIAIGLAGGAFFERADTDKKGYGSVMEIAEKNNRAADKAGNGYWNDPDMLVVGEHGLTVEEQKIHFALWCIMTAPLFLGNDPRDMKPYEWDIITNREAIAIDQDTTEQGVRIWQEGEAEIWLKHLADGSCAALLLNRSKEAPVTITFDARTMAGSKKVKIKDVWSGEKLGRFKSYTATVQPRTGLFIKAE